MALADKKSLLKPKVTPPTGVSSGNFNFGTTSTQINTALLSQAPASTPYETPSAGGGTYTPVSGAFSFTCAQSNIIITDRTTASVYPITFAVSGVPNQPLSSVGLTLTNYSHTWVGDVGMLLVSPVSGSSVTGSFAVVSGRIGGSSDAMSASVTVTDNTTSSIWDGYSSGYFKNNNGFDSLPMASPCPYALTGSATVDLGDINADFSNFAGLIQARTNGTWSLYIQDFSGGDSGFLQSATLTLNYY
jgi:hypothetical protein